MTSVPEIKISELTVHLLKEGTNMEEVILPNEDYVLSEHTLDLGPGVANATATIARGKERLAPWLSMLAEALEPKLEDLELMVGRSFGAVLVAEVAGRVWAITFGALGRHLFDQGAVVPRFGLKVAANAVTRGALRSLDRQVFDLLSRRVEERAAIDAHSRRFGVDVERDLLRAVAGRSGEGFLGALVEGADRLHLRRPTCIGDLPALLEKCLELYGAETYKANGLDWIDHLAPVSDPEVLRQIEGQLDQRILESPASGKPIAFALPALTDTVDIRAFRFTEHGADHFVLSFGEYLHQASRGPVTVERLRQAQILVLRERGTEKVGAFRCLVAEVDVPSLGSFFLSEGTWYRVEGAWASIIDRDVSAIERFDAFDRTPFALHENEAAWCKDAVGALPGAVVLDCKLPSVGGSTIEFADIYDGRHIVCAKRYHGAACMSHLFSQARAAAQAWLSEPAVRAQVNGHVPDELKLSDTARRPNPEDYVIVLAIISGSDPLPFLTRVNLRALVRELKALGFGVKLARVSAPSHSRSPPRTRRGAGGAGAAPTPRAGVRVRRRSARSH